MKRIIFAIATLAAMTLLAGCSKEGKEQTKGIEVEATIHAEVAGAMTKALSIMVTYTDFDGERHSEMVNGSYDGKNACFEKIIKTSVKDNVVNADINFETSVSTDFNSYKDEKAPWKAVCFIVVKADGRIVNEFEESEIETHEGMTLVDSMVGNWAMKYSQLIYNYFNGKKYIIKADSDTITYGIE